MSHPCCLSLLHAPWPTLPQVLSTSKYSLNALISLHLYCSASVVLEAFISATTVFISRSPFFLYRCFFLENRRVSSCAIFSGDWGCECCVLLSRCALGPSSCFFRLSELSGDVCLLVTGTIDQMAVCEWGLSNMSLTLGCSLGGALVGEPHHPCL